MKSFWKISTACTLIFCCALLPLPQNNAFAVLDESMQKVLNQKPSTMPGAIYSSADAESKANYFLFKVIDGILMLAGILAVVLIVLSGVRFVTAAGSQDLVDGAKRNLQWAILGLLIVILSWALVTNFVRFLFTKEESPSETCRELGCMCNRDEDCDSDNCSREGPLKPFGSKNGKSLVEVCQPKD